MNELLMDLKQRLNSISIIGLNSISDDFRLKKIYEKIKALSSKAPVLAKLSSMIESLMNSDNENTEDDLCGIINLVNAVLYTQGISKSSEKEEEIQAGISRREDLLKLTSRELREIRDILNGGTTTKWASLKNAYQEKKLIDYRLLQDFMNNIGDTYIYEDNFSIVTILSEYGEEIVPLLLSKFAAADGKEKSNISKVISNIGREKYNDYYKKWIEEEENENVVSNAIKALRYSQENNDYILKLKPKKKKLKEARVYALAYMNTEEAHNEVKKLTLKDADLLRGVFGESEFLSKEEIIVLLKKIISETNEDESLNTDNNKSTKILKNDKYELFSALIEFTGRYNGTEIIDILKEIIESGIEEKFGTREAAIQLYRQNNYDVFKYLVELRDKYNGYYIQISFMAALKVSSKEEIFDKFTNLQFTNADFMIASIIEDIAKNVQNSYRYGDPFVRILGNGYQPLEFKIEEIREWDKRWIEYSLNNKFNKVSAYFIDKIEEPELRLKLKQYYLEQLAKYSYKSSQRDYAKNAIVGLVKLGYLNDVVESYAYEFTECMNEFRDLFVRYFKFEDAVILEQLKTKISEGKQKAWYSKSYIEQEINKYIDEINKKNK